MTSRFIFARCGLALMLFAAANSASAVVVLEQNFEDPLPNSVSNGPGSYVVVNDPSPGWQIQGGTDGAGAVTLTAGVDSNGVGGSQAMFGSWDTANGALYTWNQYTIYGVPAPEVAAGMPLSVNQLEISMDIFVEGYENEAATLQIAYQSNGTPQGESTFTTSVTNNAFTHVVFTLDETSNPGALDLASSFNLRVQHGAEGFGFDSNNTLRLDNVLVQTIEIVPVDGDYNSDGIVDAADYVVWRKLENQTGTGLPADGNNDDVVNSLDHEYWAERFGNVSGSGGGSVAVPEPVSILSVFVAAAVLSGGTAMRRARR